MTTARACERSVSEAGRKSGKRSVAWSAFDRQTDRILIARPRLHSMQRGEKKQISRVAENCAPYTSALATDRSGRQAVAAARKR